MTVTSRGLVAAGLVGAVTVSLAIAPTTECDRNKCVESPKGLTRGSRGAACGAGGTVDDVTANAVGQKLSSPDRNFF